MSSESNAVRVGPNQNSLKREKETTKIENFGILNFRDCYMLE
jgi:hypothetical protein